MSSLIRCAVTVLIVAFSAGCSGIPVTEPGTDHVAYPSGCKDGCRQGCNQDNGVLEETGVPGAFASGSAFEAFSTASAPKAGMDSTPVRPEKPGPLPFY